MPLPGLEPGLPASEADALSSELQGQMCEGDSATGAGKCQIGAGDQRDLTGFGNLSGLGELTEFIFELCRESGQHFK